MGKKRYIFVLNVIYTFFFCSWTWRSLPVYLRTWNLQHLFFNMSLQSPESSVEIGCFLLRKIAFQNSPAPPFLIYWKRRCILYIFLTFLFPHIFTVIFPQPRNWKLAGSAPQQVRKRTWKFGQDTSPLQKILMFEKDQHVEKKSFFYTHILNFVVLHRHMTMLADIQICVYTDKSTHTCIRCE